MRIFICALLALCSFAAAADPLPPDGRPSIHMETTLSREVPEDTAHALLFAEITHASAADAQEQVSRIVSSALAKAKSVKGVSVKTGRTSTYAVYDKDNHVVAWRVRSELALESKNVTELSQCVTTLTKTMSIANMWFSLSESARRKAQESMQGEAIAAFREKAGTIARQFGYARYSLADATVTDRTQGGVYPVVARMKAQEATVPMEAGKTTVTVAVSGTIKLEK